MTTRLIETWLPIAEIGLEGLRERTPMTPFPAPNRLHVWWARRPLVASRAAILAALLPADADRERFMRVLGIHGDPVASRRRIDAARRLGERFEGEAYSYPRAFRYVPTTEDQEWLRDESARIGLTSPSLLDPTAGGGSIPFESVRLGLETFANDLNPVAAQILRSTIDAPLQLGLTVHGAVTELAGRFIALREERLSPLFPAEPIPDSIPTNYLWTRTITCPYCDGLIPLGPNWRLASDGTGVRLLPNTQTGQRRCRFEIVNRAKEQSDGTVTGGDAHRRFPDCDHVIDGDEVKRQAQAGQMGEQLYTVVCKRRTWALTKTGKRREKWIRGYRAPRPDDDCSSLIAERLAEKMPEWEALDLVPTEASGDLSNYDRGHRMYGMHSWRDLFSPRQLYCHATSVEVYRELLAADEAQGTLTEVTKAAFAYLALSLDKLRDYNSRMTHWHVPREVMVNTFDSHNFAFKWSYAEMSPLIVGLGYDWAIDQTAKCIGELVDLVRPDIDVNLAMSTRSCSAEHSLTRSTRRSRTRRSSAARRHPRSWPTRTIGSAWPPSSPSVGGC